MTIILAGALAVDLILGEYPYPLHPVLWMGGYIRFFWNKRPGEGDRRLFFWGVFLVLSGAFLFGSAVSLPARFSPRWAGMVLSVFLLKPAFALKALVKAARKVEKALAKGDLEEARQLTSFHLVSRDTDQLSADGIAGAVIESVAENLTDSFVSPLFYYSLIGLPGAWIYRFVNTCDSLLGYRKGDFEKGGKFAARLDDLLNWIPARLAGLLLIGAAFLMRKNWRRGWKVMIAENGRTSSPNAGWTMAAMAGILGIRLEKRGEYSLDGGPGPIEFQLIGRALTIVITAMALWVAVMLALTEVLG